MARSLTPWRLVCEAGFPIASPGDFEAVKAIAQQVGPQMDGREEIGLPMRIVGLSRAAEKDIKRIERWLERAVIASVLDEVLKEPS